jgi:hypothetical protein
MTRKLASDNKFWMGTPARILIFSALLFSTLANQCAKRTALPEYAEFASLRKQAVSTLVMEVYGRYSAASSKRSIRANYNLLIDPEKSGYLEILDPSKQLLNSVSLTKDTLTVLWAKEGTYIQEPATPENLNATIGIPLLSDDLLLILSGAGLNFSEWKAVQTQKDGWDLARGDFTARLNLKENISKVQIKSPNAKPLTILYDDFRETDTRLLPYETKFELDGRNQSLDLKADKYLFRDEPSTEKLFSVQLPPNAQKLSLKEIYHGKPLLLDIK